MGLGLVAPELLPRLDVVACETAKQEVFDGYEDGRPELAQVYGGRGLSAYGDEGGAVEDIIETVVVPLAGATGHFGNVSRNFLYSPRDLDVEFVRAVHALSEWVMQRALSVKAGTSALDFRSFEKFIFRPLREGEQISGEGLPPALRGFLEDEAMRRVCERIRLKMNEPAPPLVRCLKRPSCLGELLEKAGGCIEAPLDDPRVRPFLA
jgi:hypothetical protein